MPLTPPFLREISLRPDATADPRLDLDTYPFTIPAVRDLRQLKFHPAVTFLAGENGSGKSTLLEAIAVGMRLPAEGGSRNVWRPKQQAVSPLVDALRFVKGQQPGWAYFLRAESAFGVIGYMDHLRAPAQPPADTPPPEESLHRRSHGQAFMQLLLDFEDRGFYLLDEPEAALSPNRQLAALRIIDQLVKTGAQFIIATHSPILLAYPNALIYRCDDEGIAPCAYEDTEHFASTRDFLQGHQRRLAQLLDRPPSVTIAGASEQAMAALAALEALGRESKHRLHSPLFLRAVAIDPSARIDDDIYPYNIPAVRELGTLQFDSAVTFLVGENGAGKSTLLEAIAVAMGLPPEGGSRNALRLQQAPSSLHTVLKADRGFRRPDWSYFLRAETAFDIASYDDQTFIDCGWKPPPSLHERSHGEAFLTLLQRLSKNGFYALDEPEAALSPQRQMAALRIIDGLVRAGSQFVIATHSPILLACPGARILVCDGSGILETAYEDTEHYAVTRDFLNHYPRRLQQLLGDEEDD
jgi:predicted ATPase